MPRPIGTEYRDCVVKLYEYFERELQNGGPLLPLTRVAVRVAEALGVSTRTITRILKERYGAEETALTSVDSVSNDSDNEFLVPVKKSKVSAAHKCGHNVIDTTKNCVKKHKCPPEIHKSAKTDHKRYAYFAVEYSETAVKGRKQFTVTESRKSVKSKKSKTSETLSVSGSRINLGLLNALRNTEQTADDPLLQNEMPSVSPNITIDSLTNIDDSIHLDAMKALVDPLLLETQKTVTTDQLIHIKQKKKIDKSNSETCFDEDEINCFTIVKHQNKPEGKVDKSSSSKPVMPIALITQKTTKNGILGAGHSQRSIAKADFKVGRLKVSGIANENEIDEFEHDEINHPVQQPIQ